MKKKQILALALSLVMMATLVPFSAAAKEKLPNWKWFPEGNRTEVPLSSFPAESTLPNVLKDTPSDVPDYPLVKPYGNKQLKVTWNEVAGADSYAVYQKTAGKPFKKVAETTKLEYISKTLKTSTTYYYRIKAIKNGNYSDYSYWVSAQVKGSKLKNVGFRMYTREHSYEPDIMPTSSKNVYVGAFNVCDIYQKDKYAPWNTRPLDLNLNITKNPTSSNIRVINNNPEAIKLGMPTKKGYLWGLENSTNLEKLLAKEYKEVGIKFVDRTNKKIGDVVSLDYIAHNGTRATVKYILCKDSWVSRFLEPDKNVRQWVSNPDKYIDDSWMNDRDVFIRK